MIQFAMMTSLVLALSPSDGSDDLMASLRTEEVLPGEVMTKARAGNARAVKERTPYRGPCSPDSAALVRARHKVEKLTRIADALRTSPDGSSEVFDAAYKELSREPCMRGLGDLELSFRWSPPEAVEGWWKRGGEQWIRSVLEMRPAPMQVVLPPDVPTTVYFREREMDGPLRCEAEDPCLSGVFWRQRTELALNDVVRACAAPSSVNDCAVDDSVPPDQRYRDWLLCADDRVGKRVELPMGRIRPPTEGWLTLRHVERRPGGTCISTGVYSLSNGDGWVLDGCDGGATHVGRVPVEAVRDLALLLLVKSEVRASARSRSLEIPLPSGLRPVWRDQTGIVSSVTTCGITGGTGRPSLSVKWRVRTSGAEVTGLTFNVTACDARTRLSLRWADGLAGQLRQGCLAGPPPPSATWARLDSYADEDESEERAWHRFQALFLQPTERCGEASR